jgi:hypothetical protein
MEELRQHLGLGAWERRVADVVSGGVAPHRGSGSVSLSARGFALAHDEVWTMRWTVAGRLGVDPEVVFVEPASPIREFSWRQRPTRSRRGRAEGCGSAHVARMVNGRTAW